MGQLLKAGQTLHIEPTGTTCGVEKFLGSGTQGEVYKVSIDNKHLALKWFFPWYIKDDPGLQKRLNTLSKETPPNEKFLWPIKVVHSKDISGFGYIMPLREERFKSINKMLMKKIDPSFRAIITAALNLAISFKELHSRGLCYRDISSNNVFIDPDNGDIRICDNDNVDIEGNPGNIGGTPMFMAPEIVRGESSPTIATDLHSLSVLIFYMLVKNHPLEGMRECKIHSFDIPAMRRLYGEDPVFIFNPNDHSNYPAKGCHDNALIYWAIYPKFIKDLFTKAFTDGLKDPSNGRVRESEWVSAMIRLRDSIIYCPNCGSENFYDFDVLRSNMKITCWSCNKEVPIPPRIRIDRNIIMLNYDTKLYPNHISDQYMYDFSKPVAEVTQNPKNPDIWGLKNLSSQKWTVTRPDGSIEEVIPNKSIRLMTGIKINFGEKEGEIRT